MRHANVLRVISGVRYVHTNLIARDWRALARFYEDVFGCVPVPPERNLSGPEMEAGTGVPGARLRGMHLRLPGAGPDGPTLEIFEYSESAADVPHVVNRPGFAHIAFAVDSVAGRANRCFRAAGRPLVRLSRSRSRRPYRSHGVTCAIQRETSLNCKTRRTRRDSDSDDGHEERSHEEHDRGWNRDLRGPLLVQRRDAAPECLHVLPDLLMLGARLFVRLAHARQLQVRLEIA